MVKKILNLKHHIKFILFFIIGIMPFFLSSCAKSGYKEKFLIAGTYLEILSFQKEAPDIIYKEIRRLDKIFNFYDPNSELSKLNSTYNKPFKASAELIELLELAKQLNKTTDGVFDVSYGALYDFWKELIKEKNIKKLPSEEKILQLKQLGGMENIEINPIENTVLIKKEGLKIDLSGIAVGYMIDKAVSVARKNGIKNALIDLGGDIYCLGFNDKKPWKVGIKNPEKLDSVISTQFLVDKAITTSGNYEQFFKIDKKRYSHIIDPRSGFPVENDIISVTVVAKNCYEADALATAFIISGLDGIKKFLSKAPSTIKVFVLLKDGKKNKFIVFG